MGGAESADPGQATSLRAPVGTFLYEGVYARVVRTAKRSTRASNAPNAIDMVAVRADVVAHVDAATALLARFFAEEGFASDATRIRANVAAMLADTGCWVAVAWRDGEALGVATVSTRRYVEWGLQAELGDLFVLPTARGLGVARALISAACDWSVGAGCDSIEVVVTPEGERAHGLSRFYGRLGFQSTGRLIYLRELRRTPGA